MKIAIANDHAGTDYKFDLIKALEAEHEFTNFGTDASDSVESNVRLIVFPRTIFFVRGVIGAHRGRVKSNNALK